MASAPRPGRRSCSSPRSVARRARARRPDAVRVHRRAADLELRDRAAQLGRLRVEPDPGPALRRDRGRRGPVQPVRRDPVPDQADGVLPDLDEIFRFSGSPPRRSAVDGWPRLRRRRGRVDAGRSALAWAAGTASARPPRRSARRRRSSPRASRCSRTAPRGTGPRGSALRRAAASRSTGRRCVCVPTVMTPISMSSWTAWLRRPAAMNTSAIPVQRKKRREVEAPRPVVEADPQDGGDAEADDRPDDHPIAASAAAEAAWPTRKSDVSTPSRMTATNARNARPWPTRRRGPVDRRLELALTPRPGAASRTASRSRRRPPGSSSTAFEQLLVRLLEAADRRRTGRRRR